MDWSAVVGGIVVGVFTLGGVVLTQRFEWARDRRRDERVLRNAKADRLRESFVEVMVTADTLISVAEQIVLAYNESEEQQRERLNSELTRAQENLGRSLVRLRLETDTKDALEAFKSVRKGYSDYMIGYDMLRRFPAQFDAKTIMGNLNRAKEGAMQLEEFARRHLDQLSEPL